MYLVEIFDLCRGNYPSYPQLDFNSTSAQARSLYYWDIIALYSVGIKRNRYLEKWMKCATQCPWEECSMYSWLEEQLGQKTIRYKFTGDPNGLQLIGPNPALLYNRYHDKLLADLCKPNSMELAVTSHYFDEKRYLRATESMCPIMNTSRGMCPARKLNI